MHKPISYPRAQIDHCVRGVKWAEAVVRVHATAISIDTYYIGDMNDKILPIISRLSKYK